jgi:hypothetical protein
MTLKKQNSICMRVILLLFLFGILLMAQFSFAQLTPGFHYKIKENKKRPIIYQIHPNEIIHKKIAPRKLIHTKYFKLINQNFLKANLSQGTDKSKIEIEFWGLSIDPYLDSIKYVNSKDSVNKFYFEIPKRKTLKDINTFISVPYTTLEIGVTTIPFKYRFGLKKDSIPNETTTGINGGVYFGKKWGKTRFYIDKTPTNTFAFTLAGFISPTVISLTKENTRPKVTTASNELGISSGLAFMVSKNDINIGFMVGWDLPLTGDSKNWIYTHQQPWIGFGIGYKLAILSAAK